MESLFTREFQWLWTLVLAGALFLPVRQFIWILSVRRALRHGGEETVGAAEQQRLKRRAGVTAGLLCFLFALAYVNYLFKGM